MSKPTILTGLRANNDLQIGNFFGALLPMIRMAQERSNDFQINLFVPDLHSFTTPIDHSTLQAQIINNLRIYVAAGLPIDNADVHIYRQSYIPAHSELAWILNCFVGYGELGRMNEFKDKSSKIGSEHIGVGQFNYPVLMAADILLYNAAYVPVGDDQRQHIEFTRMMAARLNKRFGELFVVPASMKEQAEFFGHADGKSLRIMDLVDPTKKMSKSDETGKGNIFLGDDPQVAHKKIMSATTDNLASIQYNLSDQPGISNLLEILAAIHNQPVTVIAEQFKNETSYGTFKRVVADDIAGFLQNFQTRMSEIDDQTLLDKLTSSELAMNLTANETLLRVQKAVGLR